MQIIFVPVTCFPVELVFFYVKLKKTACEIDTQDVLIIRLCQVIPFFFLLLKTLLDIKLIHQNTTQLGAMRTQSKSNWQRDLVPNFI